MSDTALIVSAATALACGVAWKLGRASTAKERPRGPRLQNEDVTRMAKPLCKRCSGKGARRHGGGFAVCPCARANFERRHGHEVVEWRGDVYWKEPRT